MCRKTVAELVEYAHNIFVWADVVNGCIAITALIYFHHIITAIANDCLYYN